MESTMATWIFKVLATCALLASTQAMADPSDAEALIQSNQWKRAARALFLEARDLRRHDPSIPVGLARSGSLDEAVDAVRRWHPNLWPWGFLSLVRDVPSIPPPKKEELLQKAIDAARRKTGKASRYIQSGDLTQLALFYSSQGQERQAQSLFSEALSAASAGLREDGSGGYRQMTEAMAKDPDAVKPWMLTPLRETIEKTPDPANLAFACLDLLSATKRIGQIEMASAFAEIGTLAAKKNDKAPLRRMALEKLEAASQGVGPANSRNLAPDEQALNEARAGNPKKAYAIVSALAQTLYVDPATAAYEKVFNDALRRGDLKTARHFAERPIRKIPWIEIRVWRKLAEAQAQRGDKRSSAESYGMAVAELGSLSNSNSQRRLEEVKAALLLGESMRENGLVSEGLRGIRLAQAMAGQIHDKQLEARIEAFALVAETLWRLGMEAESKDALVEAYRLAHSNPVSGSFGSTEKGRALARIGQAAELISRSSK